jgi:PAS domain S-box-containing protein
MSKLVSVVGMKTAAAIFQQVLNNNWIPVILADVSGFIFYVNPAACAQFGYEDHELIGQNVSILNADAHYPAPRVIEMVNKEGGWSGQIEMRKKDERVFHGQLTVWKILNDAGEHIGYASSSNDLSEVRQAKQKIQDEKARLAAIVNNTQDDVLSIDEHFNIVEFNQSVAAKIKRGYGFDLERGMSIFKIMPPGAEERLKNTIRRALSGEKILLVDEFVTAGGVEVYYETSWHPIENGGRVTGVAIFSRDTTERVKKEKMLEAALNERALLLAEIHHRVKNNLAMISGFLQLEEFNASAPEIKTLLKDSKTRIKATALVHELLYKNESLSHIVLSGYVNELLEIIKTNYNLPGTEVSVVADVFEKHLSIQKAISVGMILNELVSNCYKHAFKGMEKGEILIAMRGDEKNFIIIVGDNGCGLPETISLEKSQTTGLMIVKTFVEQLNGTIEVIKEKGTKFIMTFGLEKDSDS